MKNLMKMTNLKKKIVAVVTTLTVAAWMIPGSAFAITAAELQATIDSLLAQIATLQSQLAALEGGGAAISGCTIASFDRNLTQGDSGDNVKCLQIVLNSASDTQLAATGVGSSGNETTYFGPLTKAAVVKFQEKYASEVLASWGLTKGTGFVGSTTRAKLNTLLTAGVAEEVPGEEVATGDVTISLAADTPIAGGVAASAQDVPFTKIKFTGGTTGVTITKIVVNRSGVSDDDDLADVKIFDGSTQLGSTQALSTLTHKATFTLSWNIPAGMVKYLTVKGSLAATGTADPGNTVKLGIASASDITSTVALTGTFPIYGNVKSIATASVGQLDVDKQTTPATNTNMLSGATDQEIASWRFDASGATTNEAFDIHSIKITHTGSATRDDIKNIKLKYSGTQIGSTVATLDAGNSATFDLSSSPVNIPSGSSKILTAYADVASGIWTARTAIFEITQYTDVVAYGGNSGGIVTITYSDGTAYTKQTGNTMTIGQGTLTVAADAGMNPSAQTYVRGTSNRLISAYKFTTGSTEGVRITKLKLYGDGSSQAATDIANVTLWEGSTQIAGPASQVGSYVTFGANTVGWDETGLFDIEAGKTKTILVKADIPTGANILHTVSLDINASTDVWADGLKSKYDVPTASISGSAAGNSHIIGTKGTLAVSLAADSPVVQTIVVGALAKEFTRINLTAGSGEDIAVSSITLDILSNSIVATSGAHLTNVKLVRADTGEQFGTTASSPSATASFSGNLTVPASGTVTLKAIADVPTTSYPSPDSSIEIASGATSGTLIADALVSTGAASGQNITETGSADGKTMTISAGSLTIAAAPTPGDQTRIRGTANVPIVGLTMTAGTAEDVRLTSITLTMNTSYTEASTTDVTNIAIYDGTTRLTSQKPLTASTFASNETTKNQVLHTVQFTASDFLNSLGIDIAKGAQKTVTVKGDLPSTGVADHTFALGVSSTDHVTVSGLLSNTEIAETLTASPDASNSTGVNTDGAGVSMDAAYLYEITLAEQGTIEIVNNAGRPVIAIHSVGQEGAISSPVAFHQVDFTPSLENIYIKEVVVERATGDANGASRDSDFGLISLWVGTTQLGSGQYLSNGSTTFSFPEGSYWELPKDQTKTLTVKAQLNGIAATTGYGSNTGDSPLLRIDTVTEQGVSSGETDIATIATSDGYEGYTQYLRKSAPTIAHAALPSTALTTGDKTLYRWTITASDKGAISWRHIAFNITGTLGGYTILASTTGGTGDGALTDGIYVYNTGLDPDAMTKIINNFKAYNLTDNPSTAITATSSGIINAASVSSTVGGWIRADSDAATGYYFVFVPAEEQVIAAGATKTYELKGTILSSVALSTGDAVLVKLDALSSSATTGDYWTVSKYDDVNEDTSYVATDSVTSLSFIWSDRSKASHGFSTADWTNDYKVTGLPATTLSLQY